MNESDAVAARIRMTTQRRLVVVAEMRGGMRHTHTHTHNFKKKHLGCDIDTSASAKSVLFQSLKLSSGFCWSLIRIVISC